MTLEDEANQARADAIFDALDDYGKSQVAIWGTAFTTYEDEGDEVCSWLRQRANAWRCAKLTKEEGAVPTTNYCERCGGRLGTQNPDSVCVTCKWRKS